MKKNLQISILLFFAVTKFTHAQTTLYSTKGVKMSYEVESVKGCQDSDKNHNTLYRYTIHLSNETDKSVKFVTPPTATTSNMGFARCAGVLTQTSCIFHSIVYHDSATKFTRHSAGKFTTVPGQTLPVIPLESLPLIPEQTLPLLDKLG
ncbi:hypothetical protein DYBT9275_05305 [Dyadobacter sp. CECT 9275]|uniref:Uncharacterized protein n=1 Tax=Dyadobacter helix TaxID=2822344 RepID=A0A916JHD4_9BACT|nr:hypothetical protein [Dyadobacter sp. CECT 9275]CAG5012983.1 hypothetical protein DYBT9275_05305 [Dyadobacter sp. CECT 9275]